MMSLKNKHLTRAKENVNDEFYTRYEDIEKELKNYLKCFKDKVVYCNCDDYRVSNFVKYFIDNFKTLGLKKLVATCYIDQQIDLLSFTTPELALYFEYDGIDKIEKPLNSDGDFRSEECLNILKQCDIVVTNPPFSLFKEYVETLVKHSKDFLIIGNVIAIQFQNVFSYIFTKKLHLGFNRVSHFLKNGVETPVSGIWYTSLPSHKEREFIELTKSYDPELYPKYDNYDAINVDKTKDIPKDYKGVMGVPITFLEHYNEKQFELIGLLCDVDRNKVLPGLIYGEHAEYYEYNSRKNTVSLRTKQCGVINRKVYFDRVLIRIL